MIISFVNQKGGVGKSTLSMHFACWLAEQGWLVARSDGGRTLDGHLGTADALAHVDWSHTRAFNMGLGRIWLNRSSRFDHGTVSDAEAPALRPQRHQLAAAHHRARSGRR